MGISDSYLTPFSLAILLFSGLLIVGELKDFDRFWSPFPYNITYNIANGIRLLVIQLPFN